MTGPNIPQFPPQQSLRRPAIGGNLHTSELTPARRQLVELMRHIRYGRIENLSVIAGEPIIQTGQSVVQEIKFGSEDNSRADIAMTDYLLKRQVVDLFEFLNSTGDGLIQVLEIKGGLPFKVEAEKRI